jgi:hypothetical protein
MTTPYGTARAPPTKTMNETPSERTEIPEHDLAKMRPPPLKINGLHHNFFVMGWLWFYDYSIFRFDPFG